MRTGMGGRGWQGRTSGGSVTRSNRASGIWAGGLWGGVVAVAGLTVVSLMGPVPAGRTPPQAPLVMPPDVAAEAAVGLPDRPVVQPPEEAAAPVIGRSLPEGGALAGDLTAGTPPLVDRAPAPQPEAEGIAPEVPDAGATAGSGDVLPAIGNAQAGAQPATRLEAPAPPASETGIVVDAASPLPTPQPGEASETDSAEAQTGTGDAVLPGDVDASDLPSGATPADGQAGLREVEPGGPDNGAPAPAQRQPEVLDDLPAPLPPDDEGEVSPAPADDSAMTAATDPAPVLPEADAAPAASDDIPPEADPAEPDDTPPAPPAAPPGRIVVGGGAALPGMDSGVRVNRPDAAPPIEPGMPVAGDESDDPDLPALQRFAAGTTPDSGGLPLMSIILIDDGMLDGAAAVLAALPIPVTIALDPGQAGVTDRMQDHRAAGFEVLALARLPTGAQPTDVAVVLEGVFAVLPEAIGILDAGEGGIQANSAIADQTMDRLARDGRGLVVMPQGLNMALRSAGAAGVPGVVILRDLDAEGQDAAAIRRQLDQAAFTARRDGSAVLLARLRPDTLSALLLWGSSDQAGQVAVVPVSARLMAPAE